MNSTYTRRGMAALLGAFYVPVGAILYILGGRWLVSGAVAYFFGYAIYTAYKANKAGEPNV